MRAFHYLVKPFSEGELAALLAEMLTKLPRPEPILTVKVSGSDVRLRYRDIIFAEHFAHMINIRTTAGKTLATRQSFKAFTEPLKKDPRFFVCGRGTGIAATPCGLLQLLPDIVISRARGTSTARDLPLHLCRGSPIFSKVSLMSSGTSDHLALIWVLGFT